MSQDSANESPESSAPPSLGAAFGMFVGAVVAIILYIALLPPLVLLTVVGLGLKCPKFVCSPVRLGIEALPGEAMIWITFIVFCLFMASMAWRNPQNPLLRFLSRTHRYSVLLAIGVVGTEGFGWPVPYLIGILFARSEAALRGGLEPLVLTWLVVGLITGLVDLGTYAIGRFKHSNPPAI